MLLSSCINETSGLFSALLSGTCLCLLRAFISISRLKTWGAVIHKAGKARLENLLEVFKEILFVQWSVCTWGCQNPELRITVSSMGRAGGWAFPVPRWKPNLRKLLYTRYFLLILLQNCLILIIKTFFFFSKTKGTFNFFTKKPRNLV